MPTAKEILSHLNNPTKAECELVESAYEFAKQAHREHTRYSGEPYMIHLAAVGNKLAAMGMDPRTIAAGLLHDSIEDTPVTSANIREAFGEEILYLVEGVTKLSSVRYYGSDRHNESLRKLFVATSQDIRVLIIKLVDRLHNMETLEHVPLEKQSRIARETLEIYIPVAHRLGMGKIRKELEDLAFPYAYPAEHKKVKEIVRGHIGKAEITLERERKVMQKRLAEVGLREFHTAYRVKGMYSLYHKLKRKEWHIETIYDLLAMRVIVDSIEDCYRTLGIIHELWRPLPGRVKDYIAFPKPNGYQSLHTTVTTAHSTILEIQIRTAQMHQDAEFGVAAHVFFKPTNESDAPQRPSMFASLIPSLFRNSNHQTSKAGEGLEQTASAPPSQKIPLWISQIGQTYESGEHTTSDFVADAKSDFFSNRIFAFTPTGDVVDLPVGATPIDFAYAIHSEIGDQTSGAKVNKKLVQLDTILRNGDIVEIETHRNAKPSPKWLDFAKTSVARRKIKTALENANT